MIFLRNWVDRVSESPYGVCNETLDGVKEMAKVTLEKTKRPEYEGGGMAYTCFVHDVRDGKAIKVGVERSGLYSNMVKYAEKRAKAIGCKATICAA